MNMFYFCQELNGNKFKYLKPAVMASSDDILESAKELEEMVNLSLHPLTLLQKKFAIMIVFHYFFKD